MSVSDIEARITELADVGVFTHKAGVFGIIQHEAVRLAEFKQTISKYGNSKSAVEQSLDCFELAEELKVLALQNCDLENTNLIINQFLCLYANDSPAEFLAEGYSSTVDNKLSNEIKRLLHKKWGL